MKLLIDKVWYTYKARIRATERLQSNNSHSQFLLVWYALISTILSIVSIRYPQLLGNNTDIFSVVMSVALLVVSLMVSNADYRGRSINMRKNYLDMQHFYNSLLSKSLISPTQEMINKYTVLLNDCENHLSLDDKYSRVLSGDKALTRKPTRKEIFEVYLYIIIRIFYLFLLYILPFAVAFFLYAQNECQ